MKVSIVIPSYNEEKFLPATLTSLNSDRFWHEIIVVDDGSKDNTALVSLPHGAKMVRHRFNYGKGRAIATGIENSTGDLILLLDADLQETARLGARLIPPVASGNADMTIACLPRAGSSGGFGIVKQIARLGIGALTGYFPKEPLSGQRCIHRKAIEAITSFDLGFGIEVAMTIDVLRAGFSLEEIEIPFMHRGLGKTWHGFMHRGKELQHILKAFWCKAR